MSTILSLLWNTINHIPCIIFFKRLVNSSSLRLLVFIPSENLLAQLVMARCLIYALKYSAFCYSYSLILALDHFKHWHLTRSLSTSKGVILIFLVLSPPLWKALCLVTDIQVMVNERPYNHISWAAGSPWD